MARTTRTNGTQKAALVLLSLGRDQAARVMARMSEQEAEAVAIEIAALETVDPTAADAAVAELWEAMNGAPGVGRGGIGTAQALLADALGKDRAAGVIDRMAAAVADRPFDFLQNADARQVLSLLQGEHPQTIAMVLTHLRPEHAAAILPGLGPDLQKAVGYRISRMDRPAQDAVRSIADTLRRKASAVLIPKEVTAAGGLQPLVEILNRSDTSTEKLVLGGIEEKDAALAEEIRSRMFVFENITVLEDRAVQIVMRQVPISVLALALKGASAQVREKVLNNLSERAREDLLEEFDVAGQVRVSKVDEARSDVVKVIRSLEDAGEIVISRDADDEYVS